MKHISKRAAPALALLGVALVSGVFTWLLQNGHIDLSSGGTEAAAEEEWIAKELTVEEAKAFGDFSLFWLGEEFMGHELRMIARQKYQLRPGTAMEVKVDTVTLGYGHCTPRPNSEGRCALPITVRVDAYCARPPENLCRSPPKESKQRVEC